MHVFRNSEPLELASADYWRSLRDLILEDFPIVPDFAIELRDSEEFGQHVHYVSAIAGDLAGFPYWDNAERDMRHFSAEDVPLGSIDEPVDDADVDWQIVIFEHRGFVYVMEGSEPHATDFDVWFRVPTVRYLAAWALVIDQFNPIEPV
ncbi:MAG: hypothetical protein ACXVIJ_06175 [Thermoanaerobaculia bacterium]